jgi:hypothetical protein
MTEAIIAAFVALLTSIITATVTTMVAERRLRRDFRLEFSAEAAVKALLMDREWALRSFDVIKHHIGGFADDDLRRVLVRAGAVKFSSRSGTELWGLLERNRHRLGIQTIDVDPGFRPAG